MKKNLKTLLSLSVAALAFGGAFATANLSSMMKAPAEENTASVTWHLGEKVFEGPADDISNKDVITETKLSYEGVTTNRVRTAKPASGDINLTSWNCAKSKECADTAYVQFSITTAKPFTPTSLTLNAGAIKTGNARMDIKAEIGGSSYSIANNIIPARVEEDAKLDSLIDYSLSYKLVDIPAVKGELKLKFFLYGDAGKEREIGFSDVCISGTYGSESGETDPENPDPENPDPDEPTVDDNYYFHIPGTLPVPDTKDEVNYGWGGQMNIEGSDGDKNFSNTYEGATLTFKNVHVHQSGLYKVLLPLDWATGNGAEALIEVTDAETNVLEASCNVVSPKNNTAWEKLEYTIDGEIKEGVKNIKFSFTPGEGRIWAFNMKAPEFVYIGESSDDPTPDDQIDVPEGWMTMPGDIDINHKGWVYDGLRIENNGDNIGWARNGCSATGQIFVKEGGVYQLNLDFYWFQNASDFQIEITDIETGIKEVDTSFHIPEVTKADINLEGYLTPGKKTIKYTFHSESTGWLANYKSHSSKKVGDKFASLRNISVEDIESIDYEGYDYAFNLPMNYKKETVSLKVDYRDAVLKAKVGGKELSVSEDGFIEVPTPAYGEACDVDLTLEVEEGTPKKQTDYKVRLFHIGGIILTGLNIDGIEVDDETVASIQENKTGINIGEYVFTTLPKVVATFIDGNVVEAKGTLADDQASATYSFKGVAGDLKEDYSFTLSGFHIYQPSDKDKTEVLKYNAEYNGKAPDGNWSDGRYSITCNDGWDGTQFKMKNNPPVTLTTPSDMKIKQIKMACLRDNYTPGKVASVTSEGATTYLPSASSFQTGINNDQALNLVINVENHVAGTPFIITFEGGGQPVAWFEFIYEQLQVEVSLDKTEIEKLTIHDKETLTATVTSDDPVNPAVVWSSSEENVATVDENGVVTAVGPGKATITATCANGSATCVVTCVAPVGDASGDGIIAVNDAVNIANYIVGDVKVPEYWDNAIHGSWEEFYLKAADVNEDGNVSVSDASATINLVLTVNNEASEGGVNKIAAYNDAADKLVVGGLTAANGASSVAVTLGNNMEYVALQADIFVPEGVNFEVKPGSRIAGSHSFTYHRFDANHMRIAIYNFGGKAFADNDEVLFEIVADSNLMDAGEITLTNVLASDAAAKSYVLGSRYEDTTGVSAVGNDSNAPVKVYDLNGRQVSDSVEGLAKGIYIIRQGDNVKKVNIR